MDLQLREKIIIPAWNIIQNHGKLKRFYFLPWLLSIVFLSVLLVYQSIYSYVVIFGYKEQAFEVILDFFHSNYALEVIITGIILFVIHMLISPICEAAAIKYIESDEKNNSASIWDSLGVWIYRFFPVFEYNNIFSQFKVISILNAYLFLIRFLGPAYISYISYALWVLLLLSIIVNILFSYAKYFIIVENKWVFESVWASSKMAMVNFTTTTKLYFLMFFLNLRVIFNFVIFLSFPLLMVAAVSYITSQVYLTIAIIFLSIIFIVLILILWYLTAVLEIFKTSLWYFAYKMWKEKMKNITEE